jgi:hypothetical protein
MTHRAREIILISGSLILLVYQIASPVFDRWRVADRLAQLTEPTVSAATVVRVWAYKKTGLYYCPDSHFYGKFKPGMYMTQEQAVERGYSPAAQQPCR